MVQTTADVELTGWKKNGPSEQAQSRRRRPKRACCVGCGGCAVLLTLIVVIFAILAFTVFKPKKPRMHVDSIRLQDFNGQVELTIPPSIKLNLTLGVVVSVTNPNKLSFKYDNSTAYLFYREKEVGVAGIPSGELGAGKTRQISTSLELLADRLITDRRVYADFFAGGLPFSTRTDIEGHVNILNVIKRGIKTSSVCNMTISVGSSSQGINDMVCTYDLSY